MYAEMEKSASGLPYPISKEVILTALWLEACRDKHLKMCDGGSEKDAGQGDK